MKSFDIPLPENWPALVRSAMINVCSLAQTAITCSRAWCADSHISRARLAAKLDQARNEISLLNEENDLLRSRLARVCPRERPFYTPTERMRILMFLKQPSAHEVKLFLSRAIRAVGKPPKHLISDKGSQFTSDEFRKYCKRNKIRQRFGAVGQYGSIAVIERFIRSLKDECTRRIIIPLRMDEMIFKIGLYVEWYNMYRPHQSLKGLTPDQRYHGVSRAPPIQNVKEHKLQLQISYLEGRLHLPIIELKKAS